MSIRAPMRRTNADRRAGQLLASVPSGGPQLSFERERFWTSYMRLGFVVLGAESLVALFYFALTPSGVHRPLLISIAALSAVAALVTMALADRVAGRSWRVEFSTVWTLFSGILLTLCVVLDGGLDGPLIYFVALPVISAALALSERAVVAVGAVALAELVVVGLTDSGVLLSQSRLVLLSAFVVGVIAMAVGATIGRTRLQGKETRLMADLARLAKIDPLTGCFNHGVFYQRLNIEIDRALRHGQDLSLIVADVDLFKSFNDTYGHAAGDAALAGVGAALVAISRSSDTVARVGGDEFAVILPHTSLGAADQIGMRIADTLRQRSDLGVSLSIGVAAWNPREPTATRIFRDADAALYYAKANGRNRVDAEVRPLSGFDGGGDGAGTEVEDLKRLEERLRHAELESSEALSILDTMQAVSPIGLGFVDRGYRILRINSMLAGVNGGSVEDQIGKTVAEVVPAFWGQLEPLYRKVLQTGEPVTVDEIAGESAADPGNEHYWLTTLYPVRVGEEITGLGVVAVDITDRKRMEEGQLALTRNVVAALTAATEMRDPYTAGQGRVAKIATAIAEELGCAAHVVEDIDLAARIHDLGKVAVPSEILTRPGRLSDAEMTLVRTHPQAGFDILKQVEFSAAVADMVLHHHERLDGSGYPNGLHGDQITIGARIIAVADVVEAIVAHRPYRSAKGVPFALDTIREGSGRLFDPAVVAVCVRLIEEGRIELE